MTPLEFNEMESATSTSTAFGQAIGKPAAAGRLRYWIPESHRHDMAMWVLYGAKPGGLLGAIIDNDLLAAIDLAEGNDIKDFFCFFRDTAPAGCYGPGAAGWAGMIQSEAA